MVLSIRRRDPRYAASLSSLSANAARDAEAARQKASRLLAAKERAAAREAEAATFEAQAWQASANEVAEEAARQWEERSEGDSAEEGQEEEEQWCVACNKGFRSGGAWENHERSRKHVKNLEK